MTINNSNKNSQYPLEPNPAKLSINKSIITTSKKSSKDCFSEIKDFRKNNPKNVILGHLNINSIRNKFITVQDIIKPNLDIFLVSETKLDQTFPNNQFFIDGYRMFRRDRNSYGGGLCMYINQDIGCRLIDIDCLSENIESICVEFNLKKSEMASYRVIQTTKFK